METKKDGEQTVTKYYQGLCGSRAINYVANNNLFLWLLIRENSFSKWNKIPGRIYETKYLNIGIKCLIGISVSQQLLWRKDMCLY